MPSSFVDNLIHITHADTKQKTKQLWDVEGIIKNRSNQKFKFDLRPIQKQAGGLIGKKGNFLTKANKMVFETTEKWIIIDVKELHTYIKKQSRNTVYLPDLISKLEWNIIFPKRAMNECQVK